MMYPISKFIAELGDIPVTVDAAQVRRMSRDFYAVSPMLRASLAGKQADAVVSPRTTAEVAIVVAAAARHRIPITERGTGTANYGQSVPLHGGIMLDMSHLSEIVWIRPGAVRALAGTTIETIEQAARAIGWEMRFFPSTRKLATIGGFIAGGTGGIGSINYGVLRDRGNIAAVQVMSCEEMPRLVELRGTESLLVQHSYGTTGVITEVEMPLAPARDWTELLVSFADFPSAVRFGITLGRSAGIIKKLVSIYEWPIADYVPAFRPLVPEGRTVVPCLVAAESRDALSELLDEMGGTIETAAAEGQGPYGQPLYEFVFGHTMLQAKKSVPNLIEIEGFFRATDLAGLVTRVHRKLAGCAPMRLEIRLWAGDLVGSGSPFIRYRDAGQVAEIVRVLQQEGLKVANPHASSVRGVGKKEIGPRDVAFKRDIDPHGLLNPGRFETDSALDAKIDLHLPTDGWLTSEPQPTAATDNFAARITVADAVLPVETRSMITADGVRLDADIYRPATGGPHPVLLMRHAYGRRLGGSLTYAHPAWFAAQGYVVVIQDVRGRGTSEGVFHPGLHEVEDGAATIDWVAELPGTTGTVGMFGFSYQALTQLMAAAKAGSALRALAPAMGPWDAYDGWAYENGALRLRGNLGWGLQIAAETARRAGRSAAYTALAAARNALPVAEDIAARPAVMADYAADGHYLKWLDTPPDDPYWAAISPVGSSAAIAARGIPMMILGGWFDTHLGSTLAMHRALGRQPANRLMIGPWAHFPWGRKLGAHDFGAAAEPGLDALHIAWFDHWLKGKSLAPVPAVSLFDLGAHVWRGFEAFPDTETVFYLAGTGRASIELQDGRLQPRPGASQIEWIVSDPWRPVPVVGGAYGVPAGPVDRSATDIRGDVATFTTAALTAALILAGDIRLELHAFADRPSFDISATLSRVLPNGQAVTLASGYATVTTASPLILSMTATCVTCQPGDSLRLSLAGAAFPAYPVNPGTGVRAVDTRTADAEIISIGLRLGKSRLLVSVA